MSYLLKRANQVMRDRYVARMKQHKATGWESGTAADVAHLEIRDENLIAAVLAIEEVLDALATRTERLVDHVTNLNILVRQ